MKKCECSNKMAITTAPLAIGATMEAVLSGGVQCPTDRNYFKPFHSASKRTGTFEGLPAELGSWHDRVGGVCDWGTWFDDQFGIPYMVGYAVSNPPEENFEIVHVGVIVYSNLINSYASIETNGVNMYPGFEHLTVTWYFLIPTGSILEPLPMMWIRHETDGEYEFTVTLQPV